MATFIRSLMPGAGMVVTSILLGGAIAAMVVLKDQLGDPGKPSKTRKGKHPRSGFLLKW